ncbi:MAG: hypothetical protein APR62_11190 [Smithella sp. SDB]|nr:MAG: hypothetical protein APR62_11190 [Smithella sp. SDB]
MKNKIRKASSDDTFRLAASLAKAFDDDPIINWLVRKDKKRAEGINLLFQSCIKDLCLQHEHLFMTEDCSGGALWYPPGTSEIGYIKQLSLIPKMIPVVAWTGLLRLARTLAKDPPEKNYYYLQFIGVIPGNQGKGVGKALIKPVLDICDRENCGAFLKCSKETNIPFYRNFGFTVTKKTFFGKDSPPLWLMWRSPKI